MLGYQDLSPNRILSDESDALVTCPVEGCTKAVPRQHREFKTIKQFFCEKHQIYIGSSTFEYRDYRDNLLWKDESDTALLKAILTSKRESRMARERSEDAVTWNVFRYLEKEGLLAPFLGHGLGIKTKTADIIYWSYSSVHHSAFPLLARARETFGESPQKSSEPDLIILCDQDLVFIEAKFTSPNKTVPSDPTDQKKYVTGANGWFAKVFDDRSTFQILAVQEQLYELMRLWLLGTWMAAQTSKTFHLVNLVCEARELDIEERFRPHLQHKEPGEFSRLAWESIFDFVNRLSPDTSMRERFLGYFREKTAGYSANSQLIKAFGR